MAIKHFGQFLLDKDVVTREDILKAIELQEQNNLKLGELSVTLGYISQLQQQNNLKLSDFAVALDYIIGADIKQVLDAEFAMNSRLSDLLADVGVMANNHLNAFVNSKKETHLYLGDSLIAIGAISSETLQECLDEYSLDQERYVTGSLELPSGISNRSTWELTADLTYKMITEVVNLKVNPGKCQTISEAQTNFMMAAMDLTGDIEARYIISISEKLQKAVARAMLNEDCVEGESTEVLEDTVMEFVNVVCGNVAAKCSQMGKIVNINPPVAIRTDSRGVPVPAGHIGLCFPIEVTENETMELILIIKS